MIGFHLSYKHNYYITLCAMGDGQFCRVIDIADLLWRFLDELKEWPAFRLSRLALSEVLKKGWRFSLWRRRGIDYKNPVDSLT